MSRTSSYSSTQDNLVILGLTQSPTQLNLDEILTDHELHDLRIHLDQECLYLSPRTETDPGRKAIPVETVTKLALYLSGPLVQSIHPGSTLYRERQMRALVSSLTLLYYKKVGKLHPDSWNKLGRNIADRFNDIVNQQREHEALTVDKIHHFSSLYLIKLAALWASLFKPSEPPYRSLISPIFQIIFAGYSMAIGQNADVRAISNACDGIMRLLQSPQKDYLALLTFQEVIRLATNFRFVDKSDQDMGGERIKNNEALKEIMAKLSGTIKDVFDLSTGGTSGHLKDVLLTFTGRSPRLDRGYYLYGLLDCAAQLGRHLHPDDIPSELKATKESLLSISGDQVLRWKAIELDLAYPLNRTESSRSLRRRLAQRNPQMGREVELVFDILEGEESSGLGCETPSLTVSPDPDEISPFSSPVSQSTTKSECRRWTEPPLSRWTVLEPTLSFSVLRKRGSSYKMAELSSDCSSVCYYSDREIAVYSLRVPGTITEEPLIESFHKKFGKDARIWSVAISKNYLVVSIDRNVLVFRHTRNSQDPLETFPSGNYLLSGLAIHETDTQLAILSGKSRSNKCSMTDGLITIHICSSVNSSDRPASDRLHLKDSHSIVIPDHDYPKRISISQDGKTISCITARLNTVLIWEVEGELSSCIVPFVISNRYTPETKADGVTSSSIFASPSSGRTYVVTTTSPSSERFKNQGEWSYSSPIGKLAEPLPPEMTHNFEQFGKNQSLVAGAVSRQCNIFAVLERTGNIFFLPLTGHSEGGICSAVETPIKLKSSLCRQDRPSPHCLRFDPLRTRLYAADATGRIIVFTFREG